MPAKPSSTPSSTTASSAARRARPSSKDPDPKAPPPNPSATEDAPRQKRRKIAKACDECRQRKSRCDGARPCGPCAKKGRSASRCTYQQDLATSISQSYIEELENRIRSLEGSGGRYPIEPPVEAANVGDISAPPVGFSGPFAGEEGKTPVVRAISPLKRRESDAPFPQPYPGGFQQHIRSPSNPELFRNGITTADKKPVLPTAPNDRVDAMGATSPNEAADCDNHAGVFGSSSTSAFMKQIRSTVHKKLISSASPPDRAIFGASVSETSESLHRRQDADFMEDLQDFILPPRSIADHLVDCYWIYVHSLYPFLHRPSFMEIYDSLWDRLSPSHPHPSPRKRPPGRLFRCILNLVFAFGCQFSSSITPSRRESSSEVFLKRARELLHFDLLDTGTLELVQALAMMGQYLQSTKHPNRCWNVVGLAIRVAQGMGLHLESTSQNRPTVLEREMYRRAWHHCIVLDRIVSMTFGRPSMIPTNTRVPLPLAIDDECITTPEGALDLDPQQPLGVPSRMCFFTQTLKLYDVLGDILCVFYSSPTPRAPPFSDQARTEEDYQSVLRFDRCLLNFQFELPDFLRFRYICPETGEEIPRDPVLLRQANVLHSRYLNIRILLFRPVLIHLIQESQHPTPAVAMGYHHSKDAPITLLEASLAVKCSVQCVVAAQEAIKLIDDNLYSGAVPAWWYYIFYLYTSASVLLAAKLCTALESELDFNSMQESWKRCIEILRGLEDHYDAARRCLATLEAIHESMMGQHMHPPSNAPVSLVEKHNTQPTTTIRQESEEGITMARDEVSGGVEGVEGGIGMVDPLLVSYGAAGDGWGAQGGGMMGEVNFDWFFEHPMWNSPDFGS